MAVPAVTSIAPTSGPMSGGTLVTITGTSFIAGATVAFAAIAATSVVVVSGTTITCVSPAGAAVGAVDVTVTTSGGTSSTGAGDLFTYLPAVTSVSPSTLPRSGAPVTVTGIGFTGATGVNFGPTAGTSVVAVNDTTVTVVAPAKAAGTFHVTVITPGGTSAINTPADQVTYVQAPTIPTNFQDIDWTQRAQVLNQMATLINSFITYWLSVTAPVKVPDPASGGVYLHPAGTFNIFFTTINAINTEFSMGLVALLVPSGNMDINNFQNNCNRLLIRLRAMVGVKA